MLAWEPAWLAGLRDRVPVSYQSAVGVATTPAAGTAQLLIGCVACAGRPTGIRLALPVGRLLRRVVRWRPGWVGAADLAPPASDSWARSDEIYGFSVGSWGCVVNKRPVSERARAKFLAGLAAGLRVEEAAAVAGRPKQTFYRLKDSDPGFASEWRAAWWASAEVIEERLHEAAVNGWDDFEFDGDGKLTRRMRRWTPQTAVAMLKARRPDVFRDSAPIQVAVGGVVHVQHEHGLTMRGAARWALKNEAAGNGEVPEALLPYLTESDRLELLPGPPVEATSEGGEAA